MKWLKRIVLLLIILLVLLCAGVYFYLNSQKPVYSGNLKLTSLSDTTEVFFDTYGVPHIYGNSEADVFRALGYIHAQERLFQMELIRRVSSGRISELFGSSVLDVDRFFRMLGILEHAKASAADFEKNKNEPWYLAATAYLDGINQYIEKGKTPLEFTLLSIPKEKYEIKDLYLIVSYVSFNFQMAFRTDPLQDKIRNQWGIQYLKDLGLETTDSISEKSTAANERIKQENLFTAFEKIQEKLPLQVWSGSNAMLVAASKSKSGKVLFENDTHIGHQQPSVWYESHLECPGFRFYGSWIAGFPFAALGHSERHAWGMTIFENDDLDFYKERVNPDDSNQVWERDHWADLQRREETIKVKDSADVNIVCRSSAHGPVCSDVMQDFQSLSPDPVSACWTFLREPNRMVEITYGLAHARSMEEFRTSLSMLSAPGLNVLYADREDNIAWWAAAKIVKRASLADPSFILDGASGEQDWQGYYSFDENPSSVNPPSGYIYSCNQTPQPVNGMIYPGYYLPDDRSIRLNKLLSEKDKLSLSDLQSFNLDNENPVAKEAMSIFLKNLDSKNFADASPENELLKILQAWNGSHNPEDVAPTFYYRWYFYVYRNTFNDELGEKDAEAFLKTHLQKKSTLSWLNNDSTKWWDNVSTDGKRETMKEIINVSFHAAFKDLIAQHGNSPADWTWSKLHVLELAHPLGIKWPLNYLFNVGPYPIAGGLETLNNQSFPLTQNLLYKTNLGAAVRRTIDFADPERGFSVIPGGQSGNPMSPHYRDQTKLYVEGNLRSELMNEKDVSSQSKNKLVFVPLTK